MPIPVVCPSCNASFLVKEEYSGKRGRCKQCQGAVQVPSPSISAPAVAVAESSAVVQARDKPKQILARFGEPIRKVRTPLLYRFAALWVATMLVILPIVYVGLIAALAYGSYYHATENVTILRDFRPAKFAFFFYMTPILAGGMGVLFMIKPLFARQPRSESRRTLVPSNEPLLFTFVQKVCETIHAPAPGRIDVDCRVNASAGFARGIAPSVINTPVLTIGLPLVATMTVDQFAGVLAHEFGHFAQGGGMRLGYLISSINRWFSRVVYDRDSWDAQLQAWSDEDNWLISSAFHVARWMVWLNRRILWMLMVIAHSISCFLARQQEFDADCHAARLIGSERYAAAYMYVSIVGAAAHHVMEQLGPLAEAGRLCDDYPGQVSHCAARIPAEFRQKIRQANEQLATGWFSTHPADGERMARVGQEGAPGVFHCDEPASVLFRDFGALARARTQDFYREIFGGQVPKEKLVPLSKLVGQD